jgi:hypothetical protein
VPSQQRRKTEGVERMSRKDRRPTFKETRELHFIDRRKLARITGFHVDELWALEETSKGTEATWKQVIDALNQLAKTDYTVEDFSDVTMSNWPIVQVE